MTASAPEDVLLEEPPSVRQKRTKAPWITLLVLALLAGAILVSPKITYEVLGEALPATTESIGSSGPNTAPAPHRPRPAYQLADHPLLVNGGSLAFTDCALPKIGRSTEQLRAYYLAGLKCLDKAWNPLLTAANLPTHPIELDTSPDITETACGATDEDEFFIAMYCSRNHMIYMPTKRLLRVYGTSSPGGHLATLAHEYGHHVQAVTGLLNAAADKQEAAGNNKTVTAEISRRIEMQANCFAGMFLASTAGRGGITKTLADKAVNDFRQADDTPNSQSSHGTGKNQGIWAKRGYTTNNTKECNTWAAKPTDVR